MCSLVMPADFEMLVSHSPPVYGTSFLSTYPSFRHPEDRYLTRKNSFGSTQRIAKTPASPKRPCLVMRADDSSGEEDLPSPTRLKKKVVFADDHGRPLTQVRIMTEPSNVPPLWSLKFLAQVTHGICAEPLAAEEPWEITFSQPASDYVEFRKRLEEQKVSLENVIVKENEDTVMGTVKVSNLSFEKEVFIRSTADNWKTNEDTYAKFVPNASTNTASASYVLYDTFSFKLSLPPKSKRLEFCVCYRCDAGEHWDNNGGQNYILVKKVQNRFQKSNSADELLNLKNLELDSLQKSFSVDALHMKMDTWSQFASWNHTDNSHPYW